MSEQERDFLDDYDDAKAETETPEDPEPEKPDAETETVEKPEDGKPEEDPDEPEKPEAPTAPDDPKEEHVPLAALKAEREKRQNYERRLREIEQQLEKQKEQEPKPEIWEDPDGFVAQRVQQVEQQMNARLYGALEAAAREAHPDYDEVFSVVEEEAKTNPAIRREVFESPNPAMAAYRLGKRLQEFKQMQDPEAYKAKLKAELKAELQAEMAAESERKKKAADAIPPDLSSSRSVDGSDLPTPEDVFDSTFK